jgi:predicted RNase H-like HicB family nuclease
MAMHKIQQKQAPRCDQMLVACMDVSICHFFRMKHTHTAVLSREDGGFVAQYPEVDVASQGSTVEDAKANREEAVEWFFECASESEIKRRQASEGIEMTRRIVRMARDRKLLVRNQFEFSAVSFNECGRMVGGWLKSCKTGTSFT